MKYRPDVDGLRAVAILAVLFFHADIGVRGGYIGVDVFFVISGFLITGLIVKDLDRGQFHIVDFWDRRIRRIVPALAFVILATIIAGWLLLIPQYFKALGESVLAQAALVSNVYFWRQSGYFDDSAQLKPLFHTWSLAVEEQFYLIFPFLLIVLNRFSRSMRLRSILSLCLGSFILSVYCSYKHDIANFYLLPMRVWELLLGAVLALLPAGRRSARWITELSSIIGIVAILFAAIFYDSHTRFPGASALLPCGGTALIIWANEDRLTIVGKLLAARPIVFIGLTSYSLYLWHWPVLVFWRYMQFEPPSPGQNVLVVLASIVLAVLSWALVETPFRKRKFLKSRAGIFTFAGTTAAVLMLAGLWIGRSDGVPSRLSPQSLQYAQGSRDRGAFVFDMSLEQISRGELAELGGGMKDQPIDLLVWGDSHAMAAMPVLDFLCREYLVHGVAAMHSSQVPFLGYESRSEGSMMEGSVQFNDAVLAYIRRKRVGDVIIIGSWQGDVEFDRGTEKLRPALLATIAAIREAGARTWIMKDVPHQKFNVPNALVSAGIFGRDPESIGLPAAQHQAANQQMAPLFEGIGAPDVVLLDPAGLFLTPQGIYRTAAGGYALYRDSHHLTTRGAMLLRPLFEPVFQNITKKQK